MAWRVMLARDSRPFFRSGGRGRVGPPLVYSIVLWLRSASRPLVSMAATGDGMTGKRGVRRVGRCGLLVLLVGAAPLMAAWPGQALAAGGEEAMAAGLKKFDD